MNLDAIQLLALAAALGWASGLRLYLTVLLVGIAGHWGWIVLPPGLEVLGSPAVMACAAVMALIEFLADKIPFVDSAWDALHTLIRIPAGAALVAGLVSGWTGDHGQVWGIVAALLGDAAVPTMLWLAWAHPFVFFPLLLLSLAVMATLIWLCFKFLRALVHRVRRPSPA